MKGNSRKNICPPESAKAGGAEDSAKLKAKLAAALPCDVAPQKIFPLVSEEQWLQNPALAAEKALAISPRINWIAYLARNPDLLAAKVVPWKHFVAHGIHEGRKLISWHPLRKAPAKDAPLVSVLIANYNNAAYLGKCISSLLMQTLKNIEIVIVDDCSTDASCEVIGRYASQDKRIKLFRNDRNLGTMLGRKKAVELASAQYIMFVDPDDFYSPDACEKLYAKILEGYDFVRGGINVIASPDSDSAEVAHLIRFMNGGSGREYSNDELIDYTFIKRSLPWNIWGAIMLREIALKAFSELENFFCIRAEDVYAMLAIIRNSRSMYKIPDRIYNYHFGIGISTKKALGARFKRWFNLGDTTQAIGRYAAKYGLDIGFKKFNEQHAHASIIKWLNDAHDEEAGEYWELIKRQYGLRAALTVLSGYFTDRVEEVARKFRHCQLASKDKPARHVGIYYYKIHGGGAETILRALASTLCGEGYKVTIFVETLPPASIDLPKEVEIAKIRPGMDDPAHMMEHLESFDKQLAGKGIDLLFYAAAFAPYALWDLMLLHHHKIPVIINYHGIITNPFFSTRLKRKEREAIFACASALTCLARETELYFRLQGINAWYISNPIPLPPLPEIKERGSIAVVGRLGDPIKQAGDALLVLKKVTKRSPQARMYLVGDFTWPRQREEFEEKIRELGIKENIAVTGWLDNPAHVLAKCSILLSTSYMEAFPMGIAEAQALGLPCVIYDMVIEQAKGNESIIKVPQRDYKRAAKEICALLEDRERLKKLSTIARENAAKFPPERFAAGMLDLIRTGARQSPWSVYRQDEYDNVIRIMAWYAGRDHPANWLEPR